MLSFSSVTPDPTATPRWLRIGLLFGAAAIYVALMAIVWGAGPVGPDGTILAGFGDLRSEGRTAAVLAVTEVGAAWTVAALTVAAAVALSRTSRRAAAFVVASVLGAALLSQGMKALVARARPDVVVPVTDAAGYSFPSGHSMVTLAYLVAVALAVRKLRPRWAWIAFSIALPLVVAVGLSRVYLGVHYPTDVLAGWALGTVWVLVTYAWYRRPAGASGPGPAPSTRPPV
jgi:undecaprenyl-diphosphatase